MKTVCILALITAACVCSHEEGRHDSIAFLHVLEDPGRDFQRPGDSQEDMDDSIQRNRRERRSEEIGDMSDMIVNKMGVHYRQESQDYDDFVVGFFGGGGKNGLQKLGERFKNNADAVNRFLSDRRKSSLKGQSQLTPKEISLIKSIFRKILGFRRDWDTSENIIMMAYSAVMNFSASIQIDDVQAQQAIEAMREICQVLGWGARVMTRPHMTCWNQ
jgi:hypothetical protein